MRVSFLPAFFVSLAIVFSVAVILRVRRYAPEVKEGRPITNPQAPAGARPAPRAQRADAPDVATIERERRYRELLTAPPTVVRDAPRAQWGAGGSPAGDAPPVQLGAGASPASGEAAGVPSSARSVRSAAGEAASAAPRAAAAATPGLAARAQNVPEPVKQKDPTSDETPPQLVALSFNPTQVRDGEETALQVTATDDISGVRSISGSLTSPTGGLIGFTLTRTAEPDQFATRIAIPKDAPEGIWRINYLNLTDNASNAAFLNAQRGAIPPNAAIRVVSSTSDSMPPALRSVSLERRSMKAGERNVVFVDAEDDRSGIALVTGVFQSPSRTARVGFGCRNTSVRWECDFMPPVAADCGEWKLEQIQLLDKANNTNVIRSDNALVGAVELTILSDQCDAEPPTLLTLVVDPPETLQESVVTLTITVTDNLSGVASVSGHATFPDTPNTRLYFSAAPAGDAESWVGRISVPKNAAKGTWVIGSLQIIDKANNLKVYTRSEPRVAQAAFVVR